MSKTEIFIFPPEKHEVDTESGYCSSSSSANKIVNNLTEIDPLQLVNNLNSHEKRDDVEDQQNEISPSLKLSKRLSICVEKKYTEIFKTVSERRSKRRSTSKSRPRQIINDNKITNVNNNSYSYKSVSSIEQHKSSPLPYQKKIQKPRRKSEYVENNILPNKKKIIRRKSVYFENARISAYEESFEIKRSRRLSISTNSKQSENFSKRLKENSSNIESLPNTSFNLNTNTQENGIKTHKPPENTVEEEVEDIGYIKIENIEGKSIMKFHVKWVGSPPEKNTYEPLDHIRHCDILIEFIERKFKFFQSEIEELLIELQSESEYIQNKFNKRDKLSILNDLKKFDEIEFKCSLLAIIYDYDGKIYDSFFKRTKYNCMIYENYLRWKEEEESNQKMIEKIMKAESYSFTLTSENLVDFEPIPKFIYLSKVKYPKVQRIINVGCKCKKCDDYSFCCPISKGYDFVYDLNERLCTKDVQMIVECNDFCSCNSNCPNRPKNISASLQIFKTDTRGWGIKTCEDIPFGTFIIEYTGEFLNKKEAAKRANEYHKTGNTYMFDLDYNDDCIAYYSIDATYQGNLSRFINHSCSPNLQAWPATSCNDDPLMHKLYYFSQRFISAGEELTIDYTGGRKENNSEILNTECLCDSSSCKKLIF
ncbi:hypothetical protein PVAND_011288 [Polypedilum vanderplanki]|uniref:Histone-lysine N-methyltransferase n=1 Tax=Polypedilum vanderplanki TaxID=319348 RepID=A0A9J6CI36_POLVA|nr:hypothetical protein PVAND_011288 [Polypedilum vanderplanki]